MRGVKGLETNGFHSFVCRKMQVNQIGDDDDENDVHVSDCTYTYKYKYIIVSLYGDNHTTEGGLTS
jgi:hypothetical protein